MLGSDQYVNSSMPPIFSLSISNNPLPRSELQAKALHIHPTTTQLDQSTLTMSLLTYFLSSFILLRPPNKRPSSTPPQTPKTTMEAHYKRCQAACQPNHAPSPPSLRARMVIRGYTQMVSDFGHQPQDRKERGWEGREKLVSADWGRKHRRVVGLCCGILGISSHKNKGIMSIE